MADQAVLTGSGWLPNDAPQREAGGAQFVKLSALLSREDPDTGLATYRAGTEYDAIAASTTRLLMGTSVIGDYIESLICVVTTVATSQVQIKDGTDAAITVLPNNVAAVGTYVIPLGLFSRTAGWSVITAAGVAVIATGVFS